MMNKKRWFRKSSTIIPYQDPIRRKTSFSMILRKAGILVAIFLGGTYLDHLKRKYRVR